MDTEKFFGMYRAEVISNTDTLRSGRIKIRVFPFMKDANTLALPWAIPMFPYAGLDKGICFIPDVGDKVMVFFEGGDILNPVYIGSASFQNAVPTECAFKPANKVIKTKGGHIIEMNDEDDELVVTHNNGLKIKMTDSNIELGDLDLLVNKLVDDRMVAIFNSHIHAPIPPIPPVPFTGPPLVPMVAALVSTVKVKAN